MAMVSASILMLAMMSCMLLAGRLIDPEQTLMAQEVETNAAMDRVYTDLVQATEFVSRSQNSVTVKVPDRDGDSAEETISYSWSGVSGDPLMMQYNSEPNRVVIDSMHNFSLSFDNQTVTGTVFLPR